MSGKVVGDIIRLHLPVHSHFFMNDGSRSGTDSGDADLAARFSEMSGEQRIAYTRALLEKIRGDRISFPTVTPGMLEEMEARLRDLEKDVEGEKIALRRLAEATAKVERTSDAYLATIRSRDDKTSH